MNNNILNIIKRYIELIGSDKFVIHWKKLSHKLSIGIKSEYEEGYHEPDIVKLIETIINEVGTFETSDREFKISTSSIFIHGNKSQVEFEYYGQNTKRELGDIIFILSIVYNNKKYFEKMTINQVKKSKKVSWNFNKKNNKGKYPDKEQLYLLSRFPTFKGTNGSLIPNKEYNFPNYSGCLGSHGLLYYPGDFGFISSKVLDVILSDKKTLKLEDLALVIKNNDFFPFNPYICFWNNADFIECLDILCDLIYFHCCDVDCFPFIFNFPILGNNCVSYNLYDFSDKYLRGLVGELIFAKYICYNRPAFQFLQDLLSAIEKKAIKDRNKNIQSFISSFRHYGYNSGGSENNKNIESNFESGGFGIIYTVMNLGEERKQE